MRSILVYAGGDPNINHYAGDAPDIISGPIGNPSEIQSSGHSMTTLKITNMFILLELQRDCEGIGSEKEQVHEKNIDLQK